MKSNKKILTALTVGLLTLLLSVFCMTVSAETDDLEDYDISTLAEESTSAVSGCDLKKDDLQMVKVDTANFKMLLPSGDDGSKAELITIESSADEIAASSLAKAGYTRSTLISSNIFLYFNTNKSNYCQVYAGLVQLSPLDRYFGDYSKLTKEQQDELISEEITDTDSGANGRFEKINGRTFLFITKPETDESTGNKYITYGLYTIIGNYKYIVQVDALNPTADDLQVINEMLNSIKFSGIKEPLSSLEITLIVFVVILVLAVAFAIFTIYRLGEYIKAGLVPANVFWYDIPASKADVDNSEDDTDDDDDVDDSFDDDDDEIDDTDSSSTSGNHESILD